MSLEDLLAALLDDDTSSVVSSVRQPQSLHRAVRIAVDLQWVGNANEAINEALRGYLEARMKREVLDEHYRLYPEFRPTLAEIAQTYAELDHDPIAQHPEVIEQAAREVLEYRPDCDDPDGVLLVAATLLRHRVA